jgi:hypothetical protein
MLNPTGFSLRIVSFAWNRQLGYTTVLQELNPCSQTTRVHTSYDPISIHSTLTQPYKSFFELAVGQTLITLWPDWGLIGGWPIHFRLDLIEVDQDNWSYTFYCDPIGVCRAFGSLMFSFYYTQDPSSLDPTFPDLTHQSNVHNNKLSSNRLIYRRRTKEN